jgi:fermentation-respiration switch protein FrsA (DUF1100 family)
MRIPWYIGAPAVIAAGYGALRLLASHAAYYPYKYPRGDWDLEAGAAVRNVWLTAADGVRLHAWYAAAPGASLVTLFLHGNAGNLTHRAPHIRRLTEAGSSVLVLDYRGYGKSGGSPSEAGLYADAEAAYQYLVSQGHPPRRIVLHGESLGSAVAVDLASRRECAGVVLEAAFSSGQAVAGAALPLIGPLLFRQYDSLSKIHRVRAPLLFLHGGADDIVPLRLGRALFEAAPEPKSFWTIPGAGHNDLLDAAGAAYVERLRRFYAATE